MKRAIVFDLDGTLWDSAEGVTRAWNEVFSRHPEVDARITQAQLRAYMGKTTREIAGLLLPQLTEAQAMRLMEELEENELKYLRAHGGGKLFEGVLSTLHALCRTYDLFIVSNCGSGYIETFLDMHGTSRFFRGHTCPGDTGKRKGENIRLILEQNGSPRAFYLGDTLHDEQAAREAGVPFVHAAYGFGQALAPDAVLTRFADLPALAARLFGAPER